MCPLSDDALLDWALSPREADPDIDRHLRGCESCHTRSRAVLREQELLRESFAEETPRVGPARSLSLRPLAPVWPRLGIAALLLLSVSVGVLLTRTAGHPSIAHFRTGGRYRHAPLAPIQSDLGIMAQKIAAARETLPEAEDRKTTAAYLDLLSQEEGLYLSGMEHYLSESSPLSPDQEQELRRTVQGFYAVLWSREDLAEASRGFRDKVQALLNGEQFRAFEEFSRQGMEWQWRTAVALLMDNLSGELDLRFSESERVRRALESNYPRADFPVLCVDRCPPDPLVDNAALTGAVRNSLDATYQRKFDSYLGHVKAARERALKIVRQRRASP
jgi:hypothetical protein